MLSSANTELTAEIGPWNHEESDARMSIYAADCHTKIVLWTVDADVLMLAVAQIRVDWLISM